MRTAITNASQIVTVDTSGKNEKRGAEMGVVTPLQDHAIIIESGKIADIIPSRSIRKAKPDNKIDVKGQTVLPGIVEAHTHAVFAGSRANEFRMKLNGATYDQIAAAGGGINTTVASVRTASVASLFKHSQKIVQKFITQGVTTLEIKSGYGLDAENELKILSVIAKLRRSSPIEIIATFLGAHTIPKEFKTKRSEYLDQIINSMLPSVAYGKLAEFCDGFCETSAFTPKEIDAVFAAAQEVGLKLKLHTDQFNSIGGLEVALKRNAISVDHLEVLPEEKVPALASSSTVSVLLPGVSYFLRYNYAPARKLIEHNGLVSLAIDYNPGSSHISNIYLIMSLAAMNMGMTPEEVLSAYTINAARSVDRHLAKGSIEIGKDADFAILDYPDYSGIFYHPGENACSMTIARGEIIHHQSPN